MLPVAHHHAAGAVERLPIDHPANHGTRIGVDDRAHDATFDNRPDHDGLDDSALYNRAHDRADHGPLHDLSHDRTALDDPPLDHRLDHAALADAALRGATLDDAPLVHLVIDDRATATRKLVVLIGIDQPTLDARAVEVVFVRIDLVPATNLRLGR